MWYAIGNINDIEIKIDKEFYNENFNQIEKKIELLKLPFKINFIDKHLPQEIYEFEKDLINKVKHNSSEILVKNRTEDSNNEKTYRRKIKKKIVEV